jgi:hypothetical protein
MRLGRRITRSSLSAAKRACDAYDRSKPDPGSHHQVSCIRATYLAGFFAQMKPVSRPLHRRLSLWLAAPLILVALTGMTYRIGRAWFGMSPDVAKAVINLHSGMWLGETASLVFTSIGGLGLLTLSISGMAMLWKSRAKMGARRWHRIVAWMLVLPLFVSASTGLLHHYGELVFGFEEAIQSRLMNIHQGIWGPRDGRFMHSGSGSVCSL